MLLLRSGKHSHQLTSMCNVKNFCKIQLYVFLIKQSSESGPTAPSVFENLQSIEELEAMYDEWADEDFKKKVTAAHICAVAARSVPRWISS